MMHGQKNIKILTGIIS